MHRRTPVVVLVLALAAALVAVPPGAFAQDDAADANATEGNATGGNETDDNVTEDEISDRAAPQREGQIEDPDDVMQAEAEPRGAAIVTIVVIALSLLVGFAVAALSGRRQP